MTIKDFILAPNEDRGGALGFSSIIWHTECKKWLATKVINGERISKWLSTSYKHKIQKENGLCG